MSRGARTERARSRGWIWLVSFVLATMMGGWATEAVGQVPDSIPPAPPPDSIPVDTVTVPIPPEEVAGDTIPEALQAQAEAPTPIARMPRFPDLEPPGWDAARWTWTQDELALLPGLTLLEFIEQLPGFVAVRPGGFGRPVGLTADGLGGAALRVRIDGYTLDPFDAFSYPLETISLVDISRVTVERSLGEIVVDVETYRLEQEEPHSSIEVGTGVFQTRLLRAIFSRGFGTRSVGTGSFDMLRTGGIGINEVYRHNTTSFRWSFVPTERVGIEVDWRRTAIDRGGTVFPLQTSRSDLVVRGRAGLGERGALEAYVGRADVDEDLAGDGEVPLPGGLQAGARGALGNERLGLEGGVVVRSDRDGPPVPAPGLEAEGAAVLQPFRAIRIRARGRFESGEGETAGSYGATATLYPFDWLAMFATYDGGSRLFPVRITVPGEGEEPASTEFGTAWGEVSGTRFGAELSTRLGSAGIAVFDTGTSPISPFGLPFDVDVPPQTAGRSRAIEGYLAIPLVTGATSLRAEGWYVRWLDDVTRIYTPADMGRGALTYHGLYIGGQFEPLARLEVVHRGSLLAPISAEAQVPVPAYNTVNFELRLRIIDVQAFLLWDNVLRAQTGLPAETLPPAQPRIVYGASWRFRN